MNPAAPKEEKSFRGLASSADYNNFTRKIFFDITALYNTANKLEDDLSFAMETYKVTDTFIQARLTEQERRIHQLELERLASAGSIKQVAIARDMLTDDTSETPAEINKHYNHVTIPTAGVPVSKLYLIDNFNGDIVVPRSINLVTEPPADGVTIEDTSLLDSITTNGIRFWRRRIAKKATDPIAALSVQVIVDLPEAIITNRLINQVTIHPYPCGMLDITDVEYTIDGGWNNIPGFVATDNARDILIQFAPITIKQLRITFRQRHPLIEGDKKVFYLGAKHIGIYSANYKANQGDFLIPMELKGDGIKEIDSIIPLITNANALTDTTVEKRSVFNYSIFELDEYGNLVFTRNRLPVFVNSKNIIIRASLNADPNNKAIPILEGIELQYKSS